MKSLSALTTEIISLTIELLKNMSVISIILFLCLQRYPQIIPHRHGKFSWQGTAFFSLLACAFMIVTLAANGMIVDLRASSIILAAVYLGMRESIMVAFITVIIRIAIGPGWLPWAVTALFLGPISVLVLQRMTGRNHMQVFFITAVMSTLFSLGVFVLIGSYDDGGAISPDMLQPEKLLNIFVPIFVGNMVGTTVLDWAIRRTMDSRRLQDQLAQNEEKYRLLFHSSNDGILVRPLNGAGGPPRFLEVNDMACQQLGYTREELLAKTYVDITDPGANINFKENNDRITQAGHALFQVVNIHKSGKKVPLEINAHLFSFEGQPAVLSVTRDISERFAAEAAIRESEERFRYMANHVPIMIWMDDQKGKFIFVNQRWREYTGSTPENEWGNGIHPDDRQLSLTVYSNAARKQTVFQAEYRQLHHDGQYRWVSASGLPRYDAQGEFAGFIGCCVDIHDKRLATEALQQAHQHLERRVEERTADLAIANRILAQEIIEREAMEERYRMLFNSVQDALFLWSVSENGNPGKYIEVNDVACRKLGYTREELFMLTPFSINSHAKKLFGLVTLMKERQDRQVIFESCYVTKDGSSFPVEIHACVFQLNGIPVGLSIVRDITERKKSEMDLLQARERNAKTEKLAFLGEIAASIAHEINQPLTAIKVIADSILMWSKGGHPYDLAEFTDDIRTISSQSRRAADIISYIRKLIQVNQQLKREFFSLNDAVINSIKLMELELSRCNAVVTLELAAALPAMYGSLTYMEHAIVNLIYNAIQAAGTMENKEIRVQIKTWIDESVWFSIEDNGTGVPESAQKMIFDAFYTTKPMGMGLGLAIVQSVMLSHSGVITVTDNQWGGATFTIQFRLNKAEL